MTTFIPVHGIYVGSEGPPNLCSLGFEGGLGYEGCVLERGFRVEGSAMSANKCQNTIGPTHPCEGSAIRRAPCHMNHRQRSP